MISSAQWWLDALTTYIWKKDFCHKFSFFNRFTQTPQPLNDQNPLAKWDKSFLSMLPYWLFIYSIEIGRLKKSV